MQFMQFITVDLIGLFLFATVVVSAGVFVAVRLVRGEILSNRWLKLVQKPEEEQSQVIDKMIDTTGWGIIGLLILGLFVCPPGGKMISSTKHEAQKCIRTAKLANAISDELRDNTKPLIASMDSVINLIHDSASEGYNNSFTSVGDWQNYESVENLAPTLRHTGGNAWVLMGWEQQVGPDNRRQIRPRYFSWAEWELVPDKALLYYKDLVLDGVECQLRVHQQV